MKSVLLTGATGLLGRYLLRDLLLAGQSVAVLVRRSNDGLTARARVDDSLRYFESQLGRTLPRPKVLEGNLDEPGLALNDLDRQWLVANCQSVLNSAASLQFSRNDKDDEPYATNVAGTSNLLEFCLQAGLRDFHHISTAYVCGDRREVFYENEFDLQQRFRNDYEQSKFSAEQILRETKALTSLTIYRPSIVVGDFTTGYTSTFHGFYLPLQLVYAAVKSGLIQSLPSGYLKALQLHGNEHKNLVPVNWVSAAITQLYLRPEQHGKTYHLTNPQPVTAGEIQAAIVESMREKMGVITTEQQTLSPAQTEEFRKQMEVYSAYFSDDPAFDSSQLRQALPTLDCPQMDSASLVRLANYAIGVNFGWPRPRPASADLDVETLLQKIPTGGISSVVEAVLRLEISGSCGGTWTIGFVGGRPHRLESTARDVDAYFNVNTMRRILLRERSVQESLSEGRIVLRANGTAISQGPALLEALFSRLQESQ